MVPKIGRGLVKVLKRTVEKHAPLAARLYRMIRTEVQYERLTSVTTPYGFKYVGDKAMQDGRFEPEETQIIKQCLDQADMLIDVGANTGLYTCLARHMGKQAIAIEPHPENLRLLYRNLQENDWTDTEIWPVGLAEASKVVTLYGGNTGASLVKGWAEIPESWTQRISVHALDRILGPRFMEKKIVIKMDVEGAEYPALLGAQETLRRNIKPTWLVEISLSVSHPEINKAFLQTFELFWENGYEARTGDSQNKGVTRSDVERWVTNGVCERNSFNWLFVSS